MGVGAADPLRAVRAALPQGVAIDDYLDAGGQGAVYRGSVGGRPAALKLFAPTTDVRRLIREVEMLRGIDCPHLVKILAHHTVKMNGEETPLVAYEFLPGGDLRRDLDATRPPCSFEDLVAIGEHVSLALEALWAKRIVHRDVKPANILRAADGRVVLADVGLARHLDRSSITLPGHAAGTTGYMSPEQAAGRRSLTINSDVFSLGVTLYELAARQHPWNRQQTRAGTPAYALARLRPDLPVRLTTFIQRMLSSSIPHRPTRVSSSFAQIRGA